MLYLAAKGFEYFDRQCLGLIGLSGHTIKHLVASIAALFIVLAVPVRKT
jgi:hypothetical protein